jgi:hypothetical protein
MRKLITALVVVIATCLVAVATAAADSTPPGPIQVSGQSASTDQTAAAASSATQVNPSNTNISIRVLSPGSDGPVTQSNTAASSASADNSASTSQDADQSASGSGIQTSQQSSSTDQLAAALSAAKQVDPSNTNTSIRVLSPGSNGAVTQSNTAASSADASNSADTSQDSDQTQSGSSCGCGGSSSPGIQSSDQSAETGQAALAASEAKQIDPSNTAASVRVLSPGSDGKVTQSNTAASSADASNDADTSQSSDQSQSGGSSCGCGSDPIQIAKQSADTEQESAALSAAFQKDPSNTASPVRVWSPGSGGDVNQSNTAASSADSSNEASTTQDASQDPKSSDHCGCGGGSAIQVIGQEAETGQSSTALSGAFQFFGNKHEGCGCDGSSSGNTASPVRVYSPGSDGNVTQSNNALSSADSSNEASTSQDADQSVGGSGGLAIQVIGQQAETGQESLAASLAAQFGASNDASPVRVWSPGGGGSVNQSNTAASSASSENEASTDQDADQSISGGHCGCSQLPIQVAGQWAGTAQLAPAFSAALQLHAKNNSSPTYVKSYGSSGGLLKQANTAASLGDASNDASTAQETEQEVGSES